jgi:hypothetical protein
MDRIRVLPATVTNEYQGARFALWFFVALTAFTLIRSLIHIVAPDGGAQSIATIPLDSFSPNGAAAVIHLFGLWGLSQLVVGSLYVVALARYRSLIPLLYLLAIVEYAVRLLLTVAKPMQIAGTAPGAVGNYVLIPTLGLMLWLSLRRRKG